MATINIKQELYKKICDEIKGSEFASADDYVDFVLAEVLRIADQPPADQESKDIEASLKKLGYM